MNADAVTFFESTLFQTFDQFSDYDSGISRGHVCGWVFAIDEDLKRGQSGLKANKDLNRV